MTSDATHGEVHVREHPLPDNARMFTVRADSGEMLTIVTDPERVPNTLPIRIDRSSRSPLVDGELRAKRRWLSRPPRIDTLASSAFDRASTCSHSARASVSVSITRSAWC